MTSPYDLPEWHAFVAAVKAQPADDLPRLVAADWLDEHGEAERAAFIRVSVEVGRRTFANDDRRERDRLIHLRNRLWDSHAENWFVPPEGFARFLGEPEEALADAGWLLVRRGFFAEARCTQVVWSGGVCTPCRGRGIGRETFDGDADDCPVCRGSGRTPGHGHRLVADHPLDRVVLTDREPVHDTGENWGFGWFSRNCYPSSSPESSHLGGGVYDLLAGGTNHDVGRYFPSRDAALDALSDALIAWERVRPDRPT